MPGAAYCTTQDILTRLVGTPIDMSGTFRAAMAAKIPEICADIDRMVAAQRGQRGDWSFLADQEHEVQLASFAGNVTDGDFTFSLDTETTDPISYDADSSDVADACNAAFSGDDVTVAPAGAGGPWQITFAGTGPRSLLVAISNLTPASSYVIVERLVPGSIVPSVRRYAGRGTAMLPIDDCVEVQAAAIVRPDGSVIRNLVAGTDYLPIPLNALPIVALQLTRGIWPRGTLGEITLVPGYGTAVLPDVREAAAIEVIRSYFGDRTGNDDRLGMTPFGTVTIAKAFTSKLTQLVADYNYGGRILRGAG